MHSYFSPLEFFCALFLDEETLYVQVCALQQRAAGPRSWPVSELKSHLLADFWQEVTLAVALRFFFVTP